MLSEQDKVLTGNSFARYSPMADRIFGNFVRSAGDGRTWGSGWGRMPRGHSDKQGVSRIPEGRGAGIEGAIRALGSKDTVVAFFVVEEDGAVGMGDKKEKRGGRDPADSGAGRARYTALFVEASIARGYGVLETMSSMGERDGRRNRPSQTISPVLKPMTTSRRSQDAVAWLMSWQVGHAENDTRARGSCLDDC